jgi:hypothetical protein
MAIGGYILIKINECLSGDRRRLMVHNKHAHGIISVVN